MNKTKKKLYKSIYLSFFRNKYYYGIILNLLSAIFFYTATVLLHKGIALIEYSNFQDSIVYAFFRYYIGAIFFTGIIIIKKIKLNYEIPSAVIMRGIFNSIAVIFFYMAVQIGEAGRANVLNMTYPIFVAILSGPLIKEYINFRTLLILLISFSGMILFFLETFISLTSYFLISDLFGLISAILASIAIISLRSSAKNVPPEIILLWMFVIGIIISLPFCIEKIFLLERKDLYYIMTSSMLGVTGQWLLTISYKYLSATEGSIASSFRILIALIYGIFFLGESFSFLSILGSILIFISIFFLAKKEKYE